MSVYRPSDAFYFAQALIKYMPLNDANVQAPILDLAAKRLWMAAPWRWTLGGFPVTTVTADAPTTAVTLPSDFFYLESAHIFDNTKKVELEVVPHVNPATTGIRGVPSQVSVSGTPGGAGVLTFHPIPATGLTLSVIGDYKQQHPMIKASNLNTIGQGLPPDEWFHVYLEIVLYYAFRYADYDQRVGLQLQVVEALINEMRQAEKMPVPTPWVKQMPMMGQKG